MTNPNITCNFKGDIKYRPRHSSDKIDRRPLYTAGLQNNLDIRSVWVRRFKVQRSAAYAEATSRQGVNRFALFSYTIDSIGVIK